VVFLNADELLGHATDLTRPIAGPVIRKSITHS
jgi:nitrite reductase (NADH) small subunit